MPEGKEDTLIYRCYPILGNEGKEILLLCNPTERDTGILNWFEPSVSLSLQVMKEYPDVQLFLFMYLYAPIHKKNEEPFFQSHVICRPEAFKDPVLNQHSQSYRTDVDAVLNTMEQTKAAKSAEVSYIVFDRVADTVKFSQEVPDGFRVVPYPLSSK